MGCTWRVWGGGGGEVGMAVVHLKQVGLSEPPNRMFCSDGSFLYLSCAVWKPLAMCSSQTLEMWLLWLRN